jgi:hypothetical protein
MHAKILVTTTARASAQLQISKHIKDPEIPASARRKRQKEKSRAPLLLTTSSTPMNVATTKSRLNTVFNRPQLYRGMAVGILAVRLPTRLNAHIHLGRSVRTIDRQSYWPPPGCVSIMYNNFGARRIISVAKVHDANSIKAGVNMI